MSEVKNIAGFLFSLAIGIYIFAYVAIPALVELFSANVTALPTAVATLVTTVVAISVAVAVVIKFMPQGLRDRIGF